MTCGEEPARQLYFGSGLEPECSQTRTDNTNASPSSLMSATQSGAIPIDPSTGMPSAKHWECVAASRKYGFLPIDRALTNPKQSLGGSDASYFDTTTVFLDALLTIADNLFRVSKENRAEEFRRQLRLLEVQALPSNSIYVPLQDVNHRVWRIVEDESIAISTKERVPCIVCLEVVEYADNEKPKSRDVRRLLERVTPQESHLTMQDLTGTLSEKELINKWRYGFRDPHRRDTALEKLRYGMLHGIQQIPLDQMKTSVKAQIDKLREQKTTIKDFWTLNLPESFDDEEETSPGPLHTLEPTPSTDIERGEPDEESGTPSKPVAQLPIPRKPPVSPGLLSPHPKKNMMGQWESPSKPSGPPAAKNRQLDELLLPPRINHGSYQHTSAVDSKAVATQNIQNGSNGCLPNLLKRQDSKDFLSNTPPKPPQKPPPVVFKEAWKDKEDRLRSTSAFGSNEGWRLLPILVKANDDLRQEQLASQLIYRISLILARERVPVWLCPYEIVALTESGGIIEAIPDTISLSSLKKNDPNFTSLKGFFNSFFTDPDDLADAKANFCESLAAYSIVCFLLQIKDRHNGNILLDNRGHIIHIDFGFFFLSSPGKNTVSARLNIAWNQIGKCSHFSCFAGF